MMTLPNNVNELDYTIAKDMRPCLKKPAPETAIQMDSDFRVWSKDGGYEHGKRGDYLMCGVGGALSICNKAVYEETYDWISVFKNARLLTNNQGVKP